MKKFLLVLSLSAALLAGAQTASAANWAMVSGIMTDNEQLMVLVDRDTIRTVNPSMKTVWIKWDNVLDKSYKLSFAAFNIQSRSMAYISSITYSADGAVIDSWNSQSYSYDWEPIAPGTVGEDILDYLFPY